MNCCHTWNTNTLIAETPLMHARKDAHAVLPGHALVIPKRHIDRFTQLTGDEITHALLLIYAIQQNSDADNFTIAINDGPLAGRTIPHLHIHVIPRRAGDVADPRGGIRQLFYPDINADPWIHHNDDEQQYGEHP